MASVEIKVDDIIDCLRGVVSNLKYLPECCDEYNNSLGKARDLKYLLTKILEVPKDPLDERD